MKIAINTLSVMPHRNGGGEIFLVNLIENLLKVNENYEIYLIVSEENKKLFPLNANFIETEWLTRKTVGRIFYENLLMPIALKNKQIDILLSPTDTIPFYNFYKNIVVIQNVKYFQEKVYSGNFYNWIKKLYFKLQTPRSIKKANMTVAVSKETKNNILSYSSNLYKCKDKIEVIYEGVDQSFFKKKNPSLNEDFISVSSFATHKNVDVLVKNYVYFLQNTSYKNRLIIIGQNNNELGEKMKEYVKNEGLEQFIVFEGYKENSLLPKYYQNARAFILLSSYESFGLPIVEAMASSLPVVLNNSSVMPEIGGKAGVYLEEIEDSGKFTEILAELIVNDGLVKEKSNLSFERALFFSWENAAREYLELFKKVIERKEN